VDKIHWDRYRVEMMYAAQKYQDFVVDYCALHAGLVIQVYGSREWQYLVGESRNGVEIKYDMMLIQTGNVYVEIGEKAGPRDGDYAPSGIYRDDNSWLYIIGNYDVFYVFAKTALRLLYNQVKDGQPRYPRRENKYKTSTGFLLTAKQADVYAAKVCRPGLESRVAELPALLHRK
jgi:hypothetical protein